MQPNQSLYKGLFVNFSTDLLQHMNQASSQEYSKNCAKDVLESTLFTPSYQRKKKNKQTHL